MNEVKSAFFTHYQRHFEATVTCPPYFEEQMFRNKLGPVENQLLTGIFTEDEVKAAVWNCDSSGSPGPDGFTFGFFKEAWPVIKSDILKMMADFHRFGKIVKGLNPSFISLIPKKPSPLTLEDYRPISLIGGAYKIISKILAARLAKVIGGIVGQNQSAFIAGRNIMDGVIILNEAMDEAKRCKIPRMCFKVDFAKAYDSISWKFLEDMLEGFNFDSKWRKWMKACVESATGSVLVNGSPTGEFKLKRGLRQGDPISPFLYLIVAEGLNMLVHRAVEMGELKPAVIGKKRVAVSHLQYADDTVFLAMVNPKTLFASREY